MAEREATTGTTVTDGKVLTPWAETLPWDCLVRPTNCISVDHDHSPMVGEPCAVCQAPLMENEVCYATTELRRDARGRRQWVCWRHVGRTGPLVPAAPDGAR